MFQRDTEPFCHRALLLTQNKQSKLLVNSNKSIRPFFFKNLLSCLLYVSHRLNSPEKSLKITQFIGLL